MFMPRPSTHPDLFAPRSAYLPAPLWRGLTGWAWAWPRARAQAWIRAWLRRRRYKVLLDLDDRRLDDIGVTRAEVELAAGLPLAVNASIELHRMARDRRAARM